MDIKGKLSGLKKDLINDFIYYNYSHKNINENLIYLESQNGDDFSGNIFRIVEELSTGKYGNFKIYIFAKKDIHPKIKELIKNYNLKIDKIISDEIRATRILEIAKYIITDSQLRPKYVKRSGQIVLQTWDGNPLKTIGIYDSDVEHKCGDMQQVLFSSDYLLFSNKYMKEKILKSFMFEKIYSGTILFGGYPRNSPFFTNDFGQSLKEKLGFNNKRLYAYFPTCCNNLNKVLCDIDSKLSDNQILLVKLPIGTKIDFSDFKHIREFPIGYESYDILNITESLITDYSNVIFDYANTRRKIIIFNTSDVETFIPISDLPFVKVENIEDLICELDSGIDYDYESFLEEFCINDNSNATENLCKHIFLDEKKYNEEKIENHKKNILIYGGGLKNNGMTSSLISVLSNINRDDYNIFICYASWDPFIQKNHSDVFKLIPEGVEYCPLVMSLNMKFREKREFIKFLKNPDMELTDNIKKMFKREFRRSFSDFSFDSIIHFNGYGVDEIMLFSFSDSVKSIWVHNDMLQELSGKDNQNLSVLKYAYNEYDNVVVVSPDLIKPTSQISGRKDNIKLIHNVNNFKKIKENSLKDIVFNENCDVICKNDNGFDGVLNSPGDKFITIGRFSCEKGHKRLISAFNKYCNDYPNTQLIIIGGYGNEYEKTLEYVSESEFKKNITIIKSILNPMPILKQCDLFIVSSFYEGWPMVIMEADALKIPIIATDIVGTQWMRQYGGYIVDNNEESILKGMYEFSEGKVDLLDIDYDKYNENAVYEFLKIIDNS